MSVSATVSDLSERELVARIRERLPPPPPWMLVGIGDDAAVVEPEKNRVDVLTVDALVEGVHFDSAFVPPDAIGYRALAVNLSDLAAMGAEPRLALLSMVMPSALAVDHFDRIIDGLAALAARYRLHVAGGNLARSPGPLIVDVTVTGSVKRRQALTRAGARPGDEIYVSGTIGAAAAGLRRLREVISHRSSVLSQQSPVTGPGLQPGLTTDDLGLTTDDLRLATAYLRPDPRIRLGLWLGRNRAASACVDLSDGLADGVHRIAEASGIGITIEADAIPIDASARRILADTTEDSMLAAITSGDDYELLFAVRPRVSRQMIAAARHTGVALTRIGVCSGDDRRVLLRRGGSDTPLPAGYTHFGRA